MASKYLRAIAADGWRELCRQVFVAHKVLPALSSTPIAAAYFWILFHHAEHVEVAVMNIWHGFLSLAAAYVTVLILVLIWYLVTAPSRLHKQEFALRKVAEKKAEALEQEKEAKDILEIVFEHDAPSWVLEDSGRGGGVCKLAVKNTSTSKTAEDVCLLLAAIIYQSKEVKRFMAEFGVSGKYVDIPSTSGIPSTREQVLRVSIHGGQTALFDIFWCYKIGIAYAYRFNIRHLILADVSGVVETLASDETQKTSWRLTVRAMGKDVAFKERVFELRADGASPPGLYPV